MSNPYSRYVPPKKKKKKSLITENSGSSSELTAPIVSTENPPATIQPSSIQKDASASYSRYNLPSGTEASFIQELACPETTVFSKRKRSPEKSESDGPAATEKSVGKRRSSPFVLTSRTPEQSLPRENLTPAEATTTQSSDHSEKKAKKAKGRQKPRLGTEDGTNPMDVDEATANGEGSRHNSILAKRQKSINKAKRVAKEAAQEVTRIGEDAEVDIPPLDVTPELHTLEPLPQPEPVPESIGIPNFSALPSWLASPIKVSPSATSTFNELGVSDSVAKSLQSKGYKHAFAVQAALIPLLLPGKQRHSGDVLVSAATGSGKTLAYVLPLVSDLCRTSFTRLRALIVVPTRDLVNQTHAVCEICRAAFVNDGYRWINIGKAVGYQQLKGEQAVLMNKGQRFDPEEYRRLEVAANAKWESSSQESGAEDMNFYDDESLGTLPDHVVEYTSNVDILICTPGRLVEHLKSTPGFNLDFVSWLVIDEADKLLDQSFQEWLDVVMPSLARSSNPAQSVTRGDMVGNRITKIVLSATVTRDLGKLSGLKLRDPTLVVLEGEDGTEMKPDASFTLPGTLQESAMRVDNESEKPLYLLEILRDSELTEVIHKTPDQQPLDLSSEESSEASSSSSDSDFSESNTDSDAQKAKLQVPDATRNKEPIRKQAGSIWNDTRGVLIFTKSNETALRLSRLLVLMEPSLSCKVGTLTSTVKSSIRKKTLSSFERGNLSIIVASDLVSRGVDIPGLAYVINYDIPTSLTSYIHRVGRTARAGREGHAWTLFSAAEAWWFWNDIARSELVQRTGSRKVERVKVDPKAFGKERRQAYEKALAALGREAMGIK